MEYDLLGRVVREHHVTSAAASPHEILTTYDDLGQLASRTYPNGTTVEWVRDAAGYLTEIRTSTGEDYATSITWSSSDRLTGWTAGNGVPTEIDYDGPAGRLAEIRVAGGALEHLSFAFDDGDRITSITNPSEPQWDRGSLLYDALGRLERAAGPFDALGAQTTLHYTYDALGNATCIGSTDPSTCANGMALDYPGPHPSPMLYGKPHAPWQATVGGGVGPVTHDPSGNLATIGDRSFTYDKLGRLETVSDAGGATAAFFYDGHGLKEITDLGAGEVRHLIADDFEWSSTSNVGRIRIRLAGAIIATHDVGYDPDAPPGGCAGAVPAWQGGLGSSVLGLFPPCLVALLASWAVGRSRRRPQPVWLLVGAPSMGIVFLVVVSIPVGPWRTKAQAASPANVTYYHGDHAGSPVVVTDALGAVVSRFVYRPFGQAVAISGSATLPDVGFTGQRRVVPAALHDYGARFYDPALGRFLQLDPVVADPFDPQILNRYAYVRGDP